MLQLLLESSPLLLAHYFAARVAACTSVQRRRWGAGLIWAAGFVLYPLCLFWLAEQWQAYAVWTLFSVQGWLLLLLASAGYGLSCWLAQRNASARFQLISRLFSLNSVLLLLMTAFLCFLHMINKCHFRLPKRTHVNITFS